MFTIIWFYFYNLPVQIVCLLQLAVGFGTVVKPMNLALINWDTFWQETLNIFTGAIAVMGMGYIWKDHPNPNHSSKTDIKSYHKSSQGFRITVMLGEKKN